MEADIIDNDMEDLEEVIKILTEKSKKDNTSRTTVICIIHFIILCFAILRCCKNTIAGISHNIT